MYEVHLGSSPIPAPEFAIFQQHYYRAVTLNLLELCSYYSLGYGSGNWQNYVLFSRI